MHRGWTSHNTPEIESTSLCHHWSQGFMYLRIFFECKSGLQEIFVHDSEAAFRIFLRYGQVGSHSVSEWKTFSGIWYFHVSTAVHRICISLCMYVCMYVYDTFRLKLALSSRFFYHISQWYAIANIHGFRSDSHLTFYHKSKGSKSLLEPCRWQHILCWAKTNSLFCLATKLIHINCSAWYCILHFRCRKEFWSHICLHTCTYVHDV